MDAVSTFGDIEDPWNIQCRKSPFGVNKFGHGLAFELSSDAKRHPLHAVARQRSTLNL
jgi:hypothetical protein